MKADYITAGEFAKLASTTKRTILWYDQMEILKPIKTDQQTSYRYYSPSQIIDFQVILLLRKLCFSIEEIKTFLKRNKSLKLLFGLKRKLVEKEIVSLQLALSNINSYYANLDLNGTLVKPQIKKVKPFWIYYIDKVGAYAQIESFCLELVSYFKNAPKSMTTLSLFEEEQYRPQKAKMKIAVVWKRNLKLKPGTEKMVKKMLVPSYKALSYTHRGFGSLLSLMWKQLEKYAKKRGFTLNHHLPFADLEYYRKKINSEEILFEINLPIE